MIQGLGVEDGDFLTRIVYLPRIAPLSRLH